MYFGLFYGLVYSFCSCWVACLQVPVRSCCLIVRSCCLFLFYFFKLFIFTLFYFIILYWFCHTLTWIHHGCTWDPKHEPLSHFPPHNIPLGHPSAPAPSMLYPASDIDWWFDSYMIVYVFQCHSPKSSHPLPLPLSPKSVIHICVFFAVVHTGSSLPSF